MIAVSTKTSPSIRFVRMLPSASGWREIASTDLPIDMPMAMAPAPAARPIAIAALSALAEESISCAPAGRTSSARAGHTSIVRRRAAVRQSMILQRGF